MDRKVSAPVLLNFGSAKKFVGKEKAFFKGLPIYYSQNGQVIAEYADGRFLTPL